MLDRKAGLAGILRNRKDIVLLYMFSNFGAHAQQFLCFSTIWNHPGGQVVDGSAIWSERLDSIPESDKFTQVVIKSQRCKSQQ